MKINRQVVQSILGFLCILLLLAPITVQAQTKVVVIPLFGDDPKPLKNIITVAKANGDFTDPVAAVNSIKDASLDNPYLVVIGPGVYTITQTLQMKPHVNIVGSGENVTEVKGAISTSNSDASSAIISGSNFSALSSLTVENTGGGGHCIEFYCDNASPRFSHATVRVWGAKYNTGVKNESKSSPTMSNVTVDAFGGSQSIGVFNSSSSPTMDNVTVTVSGGYNYGVMNYNSSSPTMNNVTVTAEPTLGASDGVHNYESSVTIRRSTIKGGWYSLATAYGTATVSQSTLIGPVISGSFDAYNRCVACDDGMGDALPANCIIPHP